MKKKMDTINIKNKIKELEEEDKRLNKIIIDKTDEIHQLKEYNKRLKNIVIWQQEIIQNYNELMQLLE